MLKHVTLFLALVHVTPAASETGFLARTINVKGNSYRYQVFVPAHWDRAYAEDESLPWLLSQTNGEE